MSSILIKNAKIIDVNSPFNGKRVDLFIENGIISSIGKNQQANQVIESTDLCISPGWQDLNTFIGEPGLEYKEDVLTALEAAAAGGFTAVACNSNLNPVLNNKESIAYLKQTSSSSLVDLDVIPALTKNNQGTELTEMLDLNTAGATVFGDGDKTVWHTGVLLKALQYVQKFDGVVFTKCFDKYLSKDGLVNEGITSTRYGLKGIPYVAETIAVKKALDILKYAGGRLHISCISTAESVKLIKKAKSEGLNVTCDVAAHYLHVDDEVISSFDTNYKVFPPFRDKKDMKALCKALDNGIVDALISDHRPHEEDSKKLEFNYADFGISSLETTFSSIVASDINLEKAVHALTYGNTNILNKELTPIVEGAQANVTLFDPSIKWDLTTMKSKSKNSPFLGQSLTGKVVGVINKKQFKQF